MAKKGNIIKYRGVRTNNLKNINIDIEKNKIIGIGGPSGSGKSSLVYDTIYNISEFEEAKLRNDLGCVKKFDIDLYENVIAAVEVRQTNNNNNPRSTIATLLNLDSEFKKIFAKINNISPTKFTFNNSANACEKCLGLGYVYEINNDKIIDHEKTVREGAFIPWHDSTLGYEEKLLIKFAEDNGISTTTKIKNLNEKEKQLLFYGTSETKYKISYKAYGKSRNKNFNYIGILKESNNYLQSINQPSSKQKIQKYSSEVECPVCNGKRFNKEILEYKLLNKSIGDLYTMEIEELYRFFKENKVLKIEREVENIITFLKEIINSNLGYLNLNRSIPSLSGGELQRLRLISVMNTQISNIMYIIDEPSSKLHVTEYESLYNNFLEIQKKENTIIFVEHNPYFLNRADKTVFIGPGSGEKGGKIVKQEVVEFLDYKQKAIIEAKDYIEEKDININNVKDLSIKIPKNCVIGIYGVSGSGKSSIVKALNKKIKNSEYLTQKPLKGSITSTIGTYSGTLFKDIREEVGKTFNLDPDILNFNSEKGKCKICEGKGTIKFPFDYGKEIDILCEECEGKRYSKETLSHKLINGKNIYEILNTTIDSIIEKKYFKNKKIKEKLELLIELGLGHLNLFRTTNTLSGGEAQRVKLSDILGKKMKDKVLFFDEPLSGLSAKDCVGILNIFRKLITKGATIVFIEHNVLGIDACDYLIEIGPGKGKNGGKIIFSGILEEFKNSKNYEKYKNKSVKN